MASLAQKAVMWYIPHSEMIVTIEAYDLCMSNPGLTPKSVRRSDGVLTTVWVKPEANKGSRILPDAKVPAASDGNQFAVGSPLSTLEDYQDAPERLMIELLRTGDKMIKKDSEWHYIGHVDIPGLSPAAMQYKSSKVIA